MAAKKTAAAAKKAAPRKAPPGLPDVRQCEDDSSPMFGAVAVRRNTNAWGVMHPTHGGHWADDNEVEGWQPLSR